MIPSYRGIHSLDLVFSSLLVCIAVELYICNSTRNLFEVILIFRAMDYTGHGVPPAATTAARGYLSYEYELVPPIRTAGPRCGSYELVRH